MNHTFMSLRWGIWNKETDWTIPNSNHTMTFCQNKITIWGKITQDLSDLQVSEFMSLPYIFWTDDLDPLIIILTYFLLVLFSRAIQISSCVNN